jgi:hypothetical protein
MSATIRIKPYRIKRSLTAFLRRSARVVARTRSRPRIELELAEYWSATATAIILLGIVVELLKLLSWLPWNKSNRWLLAADVLIVVGLALEFCCIRVTIGAGRKMQREADEKLAYALNRASRAEQELIRLKTPRRRMFDLAAQAQLLAAIVPFAGIIFDIGMGPNDGEVEDFIWDFGPVLAAAGWTQIHWLNPNGFEGTKTFGGAGATRPLMGDVAASNVLVQTHEGAPSVLGVAAAALVSELNRIGIEAHVTGFNIHNSNAQAVHILIGPKR